MCLVYVYLKCEVFDGLKKKFFDQSKVMFDWSKDHFFLSNQNYFGVPWELPEPKNLINYDKFLKIRKKKINQNLILSWKINQVSHKICFDLQMTQQIVNYF